MASAIVHCFYGANWSDMADGVERADEADGTNRADNKANRRM